MGINGSDWTGGSGDGFSFGGKLASNYQPPAISEMPPSYGEYLGAQAHSALIDNGTTAMLGGMVDLSLAKNRHYGVRPPDQTWGDWIDDYQGAKTVTAGSAKAMAKEAGVPDIDFGDKSTTLSAVNIMIRRAQQRLEDQEIISSYQPSTLGNIAHGLVLGMLDPLNIGMAMIPYYGQARLLAGIEAGTTFAGRTGYRAAAGSVGGATFMAAIQPIVAAAHKQEGRDFTIADAVRDTIVGGAWGAGLHVLGGSSMEALGLFPSKAPLSTGQRPKIGGIPEPIPDEPNPVMLPPEKPKLSALERMSPDEFFHAWVKGEVPFDTSSPYNYTYFTHDKEGSYVPFNERELPQGVRQAAGYDAGGASEVLSDIDLGIANGIQPHDLVAHLVHQHAIATDPEYANAVDSWLREYDLRQQWDADWTKHEGDMGPLLTAELSAIDFHNPQRPFVPRPSVDTVFSAHQEMLQHSSAHALLMHQRVELAERSRLNTPVEHPAEVHDRLPEEMKQQALAAALSDLTTGKPVRAAEVVKMLVEKDPALKESVDVLRALRQDGPEFADVEGRTKWWTDRLSEKAPDTRAAKGITGVLRKAGGIRDTAGTIRLKTGNEVKAPVGTLITQKGAARTKRGLEIPQALELLEKEGYPLTEAQLHDALKREWEGDSWTLPSDLAQRQLEFEARQKHNNDMREAAGVPKSAKKARQAELIAAYEHDLARQEQGRVHSAAQTLQDRYEETVRPDTEIKRKPVDFEIAKQVATELSGKDILDERIAEIDKLAQEAHEQLKALGDEGLVAEIEEAAKAIDRYAKDFEAVANAATGCLYEPETATKSEEMAGLAKAAPKAAEPVERAPEAYGKPGDMPRERVAAQLPMKGGAVDEESITRRLQARWGVSSWEELPRNLQNAVEKWGFPEDPENPPMPAQALKPPAPDNTLKMQNQAGPGNPRAAMTESIRRRDREIDKLEKTVEDRDELRRKIAMVDARYHEETLAHSMGEPFNPNKLTKPQEADIGANKRNDLYKQVTLSNNAAALEPALNQARMRPGNFSTDERTYLDKLHRYLFRPAADGEPANSQVAAYLRMTDGKLNQPVDIAQFYKAYVARANETIVNARGQVTKELVRGNMDTQGVMRGNKFVVKDEHAFKRHLHLYGTRESENFGNETPDEPAVWLIKGDKVQLSPYIPGIEAARGYPK